MARSGRARRWLNPLALWLPVAGTALGFANRATASGVRYVGNGPSVGDDPMTTLLALTDSTHSALLPSPAQVGLKREKGHVVPVSCTLS